MRADELREIQVLWEMQVLFWVSLASCQTRSAGPFSQLHRVSAACPVHRPVLGMPSLPKYLLPLALSDRFKSCP